MRRVLSAAFAALASLTEELFVALGLVLLSAGFWGFWRPGSYLVPGLVLLWLFMPQRQRFVAPRPPLVTRARRKDA